MFKAKNKMKTTFYLQVISVIRLLSFFAEYNNIKVDQILNVNNKYIDMTASKPINRRMIADVLAEPKQMLKAIAGYEREPLLPIEEACKPLEDILNDELKPNIVIAKLNSAAPGYGLEPDEAAAIHLYTMEWDERENSLYMVLNKTLRVADRAKLRPWFKYLKLFLTGFFKLP